MGKKGSICHFSRDLPASICPEGPARQIDVSPDPPILAFFDFLVFFVLRFSLLFCAFLLSFPRISGVRQSGKSLLFSGDACFFAKKAGKGGSGSRQKLSCHCLEANFDSQLPSPKLSPEMPPKLSLTHKTGLLSSFKINPAVRVIARQVRGKYCLAAVFAPRHQSVSSGPLGGNTALKSSFY